MGVAEKQELWEENARDFPLGDRLMEAPNGTYTYPNTCISRGINSCAGILKLALSRVSPPREWPSGRSQGNTRQIVITRKGRYAFSLRGRLTMPRV